MAKCSALVATCMDFRFRKSFNAAIEHIGESDRIALAGASKAFIDEDTQKAALKQIALAVKLHGINEVYLFDHEDCGAFGGKAAAKSDEDELKQHRKVLRKAGKIIKERFPNIHIHTEFVKLDGSVVKL